MAAGFPITTKADVLQIIGPGSLSADDGFLDDAIAEVGDLAEVVMGNRLESAARVEVHDLLARSAWLDLRAYPLGAVTEVKVAADGDFASATAMDAASYRVDATNQRLLWVTAPTLRSNRRDYLQAVQVSYTGGLAADTASLKAAYPAIANGAARQVAYMWHRRNAPAEGARAGAGRSASTYTNELGLLDGFYATLRQYARGVL